MIGNAVPVNLGSFVAKAIKEYCKTGATKDSAFEIISPFILNTRPLNRIGKEV